MLASLTHSCLGCGGHVFRDTPAGKALYKLYGGDVAGKNVGNAYHQRNKQVHDAKVAAGWTPPPKGVLACMFMCLHATVGHFVVPHAVLAHG